FPYTTLFRSLRNRVAVNAESFGGVRDAFLVSAKRFLNVELFEFFQSLVEHDVAVEHIFDDCFQAGAYLHLSPVLLSYEIYRVLNPTRPRANGGDGVFSNSVCRNPAATLAVLT